VLPAYCTNVLAGRTLDETRSAVIGTMGAVRARVAPGSVLPIGLWLSARAAQELAAATDGARRLRDEFANAGLSVVTLNGFPYHDFHLPTVKHLVYEPHWADVRRLIHTTQLADLLVDLLPAGTTRASISTLPLGWRERFSLEGCGASIGLAGAMLEQLAAHLARLEDRTGVRITVDLEPEPGCMLDRTRDVVGFFDHALRSRAGGPDVRRYVGVCHDTCHSAVMFEGQREALRAYRDAGIGVHKVQVSSAIEADGSPDSVLVLSTFAEPRWLHQTCVRRSDGSVGFWEDLPFALASGTHGTWRTHFHVPVFAARLGALATTQDAIVECLEELASWPEDERPQLEVETYAWDALPDGAREGQALVDGIAREVEWCAGAARRAGFVRAGGVA
jgi:sugar phosphate isomerase/epimerase